MREFRPMSVSDILDTTFRLYRERFLTFFLIALVVYVPYSLLAALLIPAPPAVQHLSPGQVPHFDLMAMVPGYIGLFVFAVIFLPLCSAALTLNISSAYLGKELSAGESYQRATPRLAGLIGTQFLAGLIILLGLFLLIVPGIIFAFWFYVLIPVVVLEGVGGTAALGRSRELMRGNIGKAFLVGLLAGLVAAIIGGVLGFLLGLAQPPYIVLVFAQTLLHAVLLPIQTAPIILLYYDLRIRKEAFDLQMLSTAMEQPAT